MTAERARPLAALLLVALLCALIVALGTDQVGTVPRADLPGIARPVPAQNLVLGNRLAAREQSAGQPVGQSVGQPGSLTAAVRGDTVVPALAVQAPRPRARSGKARAVDRRPHPPRTTTAPAARPRPPAAPARATPPGQAVRTGHASHGHGHGRPAHAGHGHGHGYGHGNPGHAGGPRR